jgi:hypothetical protein
MKTIIDAIVNNQTLDTPDIVRNAMLRLQDKFSKPPVPVMTPEEWVNASPTEKMFLICNFPKCPNVVSTHGLVCVYHKNNDDYILNYNI